MPLRATPAHKDFEVLHRSETCSAEMAGEKLPGTGSKGVALKTSAVLANVSVLYIWTRSISKLLRLAACPFNQLCLNTGTGG